MLLDFISLPAIHLPTPRGWNGGNKDLAGLETGASKNSRRRHRAATEQGQGGCMNIMPGEARVGNETSTSHWLSEPFAFLPVVVDALNKSDVSCRLCSVKMISFEGIVDELCPACFEDRCAECGDGVLSERGRLKPGLTVGFGGSWRCANCSAPARR